MLLYQDQLAATEQAARAAQALLLAEVARTGGPRGSDGHCPADTETERLIRARLLDEFPRYGFRGEETGFQPTADAGGPIWVVDPNDGTEAMHAGFRGHAVSIALVTGGVPVLGVVLAVNAPDDEGDLFTWAEGSGPLRRNGKVVQHAPWPDDLQAHHVVLVSHAADVHPAGNLACTAPARMRPMPSIAYRLALVAADEGAAAVSLNSPCSWDYAGGHALLRGAGGELVDANGDPVRYDDQAWSQAAAVFGGGLAAIQELRGRDWERVLGSGWGAAKSWSQLRPRTPQKGRLEHNAERLRRAHGCLIGQVAGDALGALVEFQSAGRIARQYPDGGPRLLADGGPHRIAAGQPTDDSEMALLLARTIARVGSYDPEVAAAAYACWYHGWTGSELARCAHSWCTPFDVGGTTSQALGAITPEVVARGEAAQASHAAASRASQANGALMRVSPLGVWGASGTDEEVASAARRDAQITHPHAVCQDASAAYAVSIAAAIRDGLDAASTYERALTWGRSADLAGPVLEALERAATEPPSDYQTQQGWVLIALQNAFYQLLHAPSLEEGVVATVRAGGDTDTNAAICGALLGALYGREAVPAQWRQMVLTCRPMPGSAGIAQPRPALYWPTDLLVLGDQLLQTSDGGS